MVFKTPLQIMNMLLYDISGRCNTDQSKTPEASPGRTQEETRLQNPTLSLGLVPRLPDKIK